MDDTMMPRADASTPTPWRWGSKLDQIVTDDGATIDFHGAKIWFGSPLTYEELKDVADDDDLIRLLTPAVERITLRGCSKLTNACIEAVAKTCPSLAKLDVWECSNLTDASMTAVAGNCPELTVLNVGGCSQLTDASITAVAGNCASLTELDASECSQLTDASIAAVAENCRSLTRLIAACCTNLTDTSIAVIADNCRNLEYLDVESCNLNALPANIGTLWKLRFLDASSNLIKELPRSIVELPLCCLRVNDNPLQTPPVEIAERGSMAIRRYFDDLDDAGGEVSTELKVVLCGDACAGKTSLRNALAGRENPRQSEDARTIHLDTESLRILDNDIQAEGDNRTLHTNDDNSGALRELSINVCDLGGQDEYAVAQTLYLSGLVLFVLVVEVFRACDEHADDVLLRLLDLLQTRAPTATVLLVLSKVDLIGNDAERVDELCAWLLRNVNKRLDAWRVKCRRDRGDQTTEIPIINVEQKVIAVAVGDDGQPSLGVDEIKAAVIELAASERFPNIGQRIPTTWGQLRQLATAIAQHGNTVDAFEAMRGKSTTTLSHGRGAPAGAYRPVDELRETFRAWRLRTSPLVASIQNEVDLRAFLEKCDSIFEDMMMLMVAQGAVIVEFGLVFLEPDILVELAKPLVDHRKLKMNLPELQSFVESRELAISAVDLRQQLEDFVQHGEVRSEVLLYLWQELPHVKVEHYPQIIELLNASGLIVAQVKDRGARAVVFARLPRSPPNEFGEYWSKQLEVDASADVVVREATMSVVFDCGGCPLGLVQSVVASVYAFGTVKFSWREGVVVTSNVDENGNWYHVRLTRKDDGEGGRIFELEIVFRTTSQRELQAHKSFFAHSLHILDAEKKERFPGSGFTAYVECPKCGYKTTVWDSRIKRGLRAVACRCGHNLLATTDVARVSVVSDRDFKAVVLRELAVIRRIGTDTAARVERVEAKADRNFNAMLDFARDGDKYPWLFIVVPAKSSQDRFSVFSRRLVIVFFCEEPLERVEYDGDVGLEFSVPTRFARDTLEAASRFWRKYGPIVKFSATSLAAAVKCAANVDLAALVPNEAIRSVVGAGTDRADFVDKYAERVTSIVDVGTAIVDWFESANEGPLNARRAARLDEASADDLVRQARESYVEFHDFLKSVGFDARKLPMRWVAGDDGRIRWVRVRPAPDDDRPAPDDRPRQPCCNIA